MCRTISPTFFRFDCITLTSNARYKFFLTFHGLTVFLTKWFISCRGCDGVTILSHSYLDSAKSIANLLTTRQLVVDLKTISHQCKYVQLDRLDYLCYYFRAVQSYSVNCQTACGLGLLAIICGYARCARCKYVSKSFIILTRCWQKNKRQWVKGDFDSLIFHSTFLCQPWKNYCLKSLTIPTEILPIIVANIWMTF